MTVAVPPGLIFSMVQELLVGHGFFIIEASLRHTTFSRIHSDKWSAPHKENYLTTQNTHKRQTDRHVPAGFEHANPASERPQNHALDRAATGIGTEPDASAI
jgi:hypothetical protein